MAKGKRRRKSPSASPAPSPEPAKKKSSVPFRKPKKAPLAGAVSPSVAGLSIKSPSKHLFVGIDPGKKGAIAILYPGGTVVSFHVPIRKGGDDYDAKRIWKIIHFLRVHRRMGWTIVIAMEYQSPRFWDTRKVVFAIGRGTSYWTALLELASFSYKTVTPGDWKSAYVYKDAPKSESVAQAIKLYGCNLPLSKDEARAEAILIADYYKRLYFGWTQKAKRGKK